LDSERNVLLCDFAGSGIDGDEPTVRAQAGFKHPDSDENDNVTIRLEIHALGSTIYEIVTSYAPHSRFEEWMVEPIRELKRKYPRAKDCPDDEAEDWMIEEWIKEGRYPDVGDVELGEVMDGCWKGRFGSAGEVARKIEGYEKLHFIGEGDKPGETLRDSD
jgi:hypothetical protein